MAGERERSDLRRRDGMGGRCRCECRVGVKGALRWRSQEMRGDGNRADCSVESIAAHCAVVSAVPAAACGEARFVVLAEEGNKWTQGEEEGEQDGEAAPHLEPMVHETGTEDHENRERGGKPERLSQAEPQVSSMHRQKKETMGPQKSSPVVEKAEFAREARLRQPLRIALFGFGTVGGSVARILVESKPEGLELTHVFNRNVARKKVDWAPANLVWSRGCRRCAGFGRGRDRGTRWGAGACGDMGAQGARERQKRCNGKQKADCLSRRGTGTTGGGAGRPSEVRRGRGRRNSGDSRPGAGSGRRPHRADGRDSERDVQLHSEPDGGRRGVCDGAGDSAGEGLCRGRSDRRCGRIRRAGQSWRS